MADYILNFISINTSHKCPSTVLIIAQNALFVYSVLTELKCVAQSRFRTHYNKMQLTEIPNRISLRCTINDPEDQELVIRVY